MLVIAVTSVVEQVHQRTSQEQQIGEKSEQVRAVLGKQEEAGYRQKADQYQFLFGHAVPALTMIVPVGHPALTFRLEFHCGWIYSNCASTAFADPGMRTVRKIW